jgi:hypothetical protein
MPPSETHRHKYGNGETTAANDGDAAPSDGYCPKRVAFRAQCLQRASDAIFLLVAIERISISPSLTHQFATRRLCQIYYIPSAGDAVRNVENESVLK